MCADWCRNWWKGPPGMDLGVSLQHQGNMPYSGRQMLLGPSAAQQLQLQQLLQVACLQQGELVSGCTNLQMCWRCMLSRTKPGLKHPVHPLQGPRLSALKGLASAMQRQPGAQTAQAQIPVMWPALLQLLVDAQQLVRQAAAPVVGMLGALATRAGRPPGRHSHRQGSATSCSKSSLQDCQARTAAPACSASVLLWPPASALHS